MKVHTKINVIELQCLLRDHLYVKSEEISVELELTNFWLRDMYSTRASLKSRMKLRFCLPCIEHAKSRVFFFFKFWVIDNRCFRLLISVVLQNFYALDTLKNLGLFVLGINMKVWKFKDLPMQSFFWETLSKIAEF